MTTGNSKYSKIFGILSYKLPAYLLVIILIVLLFILTSVNYYVPFLGTQKKIWNKERSIFSKAFTVLFHPAKAVIDTNSSKNKTVALSLEDDLKNYIEAEKSKGDIEYASVYFKKLNGNENFSINAEQKYKPGSLMKVLMMMAYFKESETNPSILNKTIVDTLPESAIGPQTFEIANIELGIKYSMFELIRNMIIYSDNYATWYLLKNIGTDMTRKTILAVGFPDPNILNGPLFISAEDYSQVLLTLYQSSFLSEKNSLLALSILQESAFDKGFTKQLPPSLKVAHKFGEQYDASNHELHESGIFYLNNNPYLLTVMTRGNDVQRQASILSDISKMVYDYESIAL